VLKCPFGIDSMPTIKFLRCCALPILGHAVGIGVSPLPYNHPARQQPFSIQQGSSNMKKAVILVGAMSTFAFSAPALAGQCAAGQNGTNALAGAATMPKDVTDTVVGRVDLGPEINVDGRSLRLRRLVLQPGGIVPMHSHADRPALIITVSGEVTEYRSTCKTPIVHRAGEVSQESGGLSHWWKNTGKTKAVLLSADVFNDRAK
jgi:quercetin dioxygenase-like cupin family protein